VVAVSFMAELGVYVVRNPAEIGATVRQALVA
jgi:hypothetical protein